MGYLYRLPAATFTPVDEHQWVSYKPVMPLDFTVINPRDYAHWVALAPRDPARANVRE